VAIVPHTHWDREWYLPFETFRMRLVALLDALLPALEADPSYAHFLLDGQMAVVDDYLAIRPEAQTVLERLTAAGRLSMGPWYTLPDEFLVSGETLVRNLELGLARAARFGGAMDVGYLPDMFGHIAQMPQILREFGFEHAVVWRGVPSTIDRTAFWWSAPDGSVVRAEYLPSGYGNGAATPKDSVAFLDRIGAWEAEHDAMLGDADILWMNGTDHQVPQPWLPEVVAEAQAKGAYDVTITSLVDHLRRAPVDGLASWAGELRSGARANLLMGVTSNRVDVRGAAARAERAVERDAEPLAALFLPPEAWPGALLDEAWLAMVHNAAHDSVCACSVDEVCDAVLGRYDRARQIGEGISVEALRALGGSLAVPGWVAVNQTARPRAGVVEIEVGADDVPTGAQVVRSEAAQRELFTLPAEPAVAVLGEMVGWMRGLTGVTFVSGENVEVVLHADGAQGEPPTPWHVMQRLRDLTASRPSSTVHAVVARRPSAVIAVRTPTVPGFGWGSAVGQEAFEPAVAGATELRNGLVTVAVDPTTGTFSIDGHKGLGRLVDGGDVGDTYNYCPPAHDTVVDHPRHVGTAVGETGPVRASLVVTSTYPEPIGIVRTTLSLHAGERLVRVEVDLTNTRGDHRVRAHFPLPEAAAASHAGCAFAVVERGLEAEGGPTEAALATFPSRHFVQAGDLTVVHDGVHEYELVAMKDGLARELALTLLRATGWLSRGPMASRPLPAGPAIALEGSKVLGRHRLRYAVQLGSCNPYAVADDAFVPLRTALGAGTGTRPQRGEALHVTGAEVTSVRRRAGAVEVRLVAGREPARVDIGEAAGWLVDLRGRPLERVIGSFDLRAAGIATVRLDP
jgi:hypothetical protein